MQEDIYTAIYTFEPWESIVGALKTVQPKSSPNNSTITFEIYFLTVWKCDNLSFVTLCNSAELDAGFLSSLALA